MSKLGLETAALLIGLPARHETLVENFPPRMDFHAEFDVGVVHVCFGFGQSVVADAYRLAGKCGPVGIGMERLQTQLQHLRLGPAMRLGEKQERATSLRRAG